MSDSGDFENFFPSTSRFRRLAVLGRGSTGVVYRVHDRETDLEVALKTFSFGAADDLYRLKAEFRILADTTHPNLVELYELVVQNGSSFFTMEYVDGSPLADLFPRDRAIDIDRLASIVGQFVAGIDALHAGGKLHRDIKPSNLLIGRDGRLVLLDFGLATAFGLEVAPHYGQEIAGTVGFIAPEVLLGQRPTPDADWFSLGAVLYDTFTGEVPFTTTQLLIGSRKPARSPKTIDSRIPDDWDAAVQHLVDRRPELRQVGAELLRRLTGLHSTARRQKNRTAPFIGRQSELRTIAELFSAVNAGGHGLVHVVGPSGIGKSELIRHFLEQASTTPAGDRSRPCRVLQGRCHPNEVIPFKAFDRVIDGLTQLLLITPELGRRHSSNDPGALLRLFPVLARVPEFAINPTSEDTAEPQELRRRGVAALHQLLADLASDAAVIIALEDLHWSDADSMQVLRDLLRSPIPGLLVLLSYRGNDTSDDGFVEQIRSSLGPVEQRVVELGPLSDEETIELVHSLTDSNPSSDETLQQIIADSHGNPFLVCQLARSAADGRPSTQMADLITDRVRELPDQARALLELVSVAGSPLQRGIALAAGGLGERGRPLLSNLEKRFLLRSSPLHDDIAVEIYHDRIREALLATLSLDQTKKRHADLADTLLRQPERDAEALFRHSLGADRREQAGEWAVLAADRAADSLAFQRAADLYRQALTLPLARVPRWQLLERQAQALANAGRAVEAAGTYQEAGLALTESSPNDPHVLALRQHAATHYLQTGHLTEGVAAFRQVLESVGIRYPQSNGEALRTVIRLRARLAWRGLDFDVRNSELSPRTRRRLEACGDAAMSLASVDQTVADALGVRHLMESLDAGDPIEISRAIGVEAAKTSQLGGAFMRRRCTDLLCRMNQVVQSHGGAYQRAHHRMITGFIGFQSGHWEMAHENLSAAAKILRQNCVGVTWQLVTIETFGLSALAHLGRLDELSHLLPRVIGHAEERGDRYAALLFQTGVLSLVWLAADQPDDAIAVADAAMANWPPSEIFQIQHYVHLIAVVHADLYRGDPWTALQRLEEAWPRLRAAFFLALESPRVELRNLRARALLAAAASMHSMPPTLPAKTRRRWTKKRLLAQAHREAKQLARARHVVSSAPFASLVEAGIALARRQIPVATRHLIQAANQFDEIGMSLYAAAARLRLAQLLPADLVHATYVRSYAAKQRIARIDRLAGVFAPVVPHGAPASDVLTDIPQTAEGSRDRQER